MRPPLLSLLFSALLFLPAKSRAWDAKGHRTIAAIAWDHMDAETRTKAVALLRAVPADSDLLDEDEVSTLPQPERDRQLFLRASTWPDLVRSTAVPARRAKYHKSTWHYVNIFWQRKSNGQVIERTDMGMKGDLLMQLAARAAMLADPNQPDAERGLALAWFEHLVGDAHEPLHASARVTTVEPQGDRGGNTFCLSATHAAGKHDCSKSLHALWDDILVSNRPGQTAEAISALIQTRHGKPLLLHLDAYEKWARESYTLAVKKVYRPSLQRRQKPSATYYADALTAAEPRLALAGYRLGEGLNALLR